MATLRWACPGSLQVTQLLPLVASMEPHVYRMQYQGSLAPHPEQGPEEAAENVYKTKE